MHIFLQNAEIKGVSLQFPHVDIKEQSLHAANQTQRPPVSAGTPRGVTAEDSPCSTLTVLGHRACLWRSFPSLPTQGSDTP